MPQPTPRSRRTPEPLRTPARVLSAQLSSACLLALLLLLFFPLAPAAQAQSADAPPLTPAATHTLVRTVLAREDAALNPSTIWMRYRLRKSSPRLSTTKWIVETRNGDVAHLVAWNDLPLSAERSCAGSTPRPLRCTLQRFTGVQASSPRASIRPPSMCSVAC